MSNPRTAYFSTGDNQDLLGLPLDSQASIEAAFESLRQRYRVSRVWWRGGQEEVWGHEFVLRPENRQFARLWQWWKYLAYEGVGTNRIAVQAAHARGMRIWMAYGLFDNGSSPDVGYAGFPYAVEDRIRVEHPEFAPVNRYGTRRQGGPLEFAYPGARRAMVDYLTKYTIEGGYDGLAFLTYAENFSQRYEDEFGFSPPIVEEFRKRYGIDLRTQPFDREAWSRLRGEYLTQFLRELRGALSKHGKRIAVCVDSGNPHLPVLWNVSGGVRTAGRIHLDIETWVNERLVDEITVWPGTSDETIGQVHELCRGTRTAASSLRTRGPLPEGVQRIMFLGIDVESGFDWEHYVDYPDERIPPQPEQALRDPDAFARRRVLTAIVKGKQKVPVRDVIAATKDTDLFVRRLAIRALGVMGDPSGIPAVEAALVDPENSVRCQAAVVLATLSASRCVGQLCAIAARPESTFQFQFRAVPQALKQVQASGKLGPQDKECLLAQLADPAARVREAALYCLLLVGAPATPDAEAALTKIVRGDPSPYAKEMALDNLRSSLGATASVLALVREAMKDRDEAVQVRAAGILARLCSAPDARREERARCLQELTGFFRQYGDACRRSDAAWGWREVGASLLSLGDDGRTVLLKLLEDRQDRRLAQLAWHILFAPQGDQFYPTTAEQDREAHARYPL